MPDGKSANFGRSIGKTSPVGSYLQGVSPYGLMDMSGNGWEWCTDWYGSNYYKVSHDRNPMGPENGTKRVLRGGSWNVIARKLRCVYRNVDRPSSRSYNVGFRLCQDNF